MKTRYLLLIITAIVIFIGSCKNKGEETDFNPNVNSSKDYIYAEDIFFEMLHIYLIGIKDPTVLNEYYAYLDDCAILYTPQQNSMRFDYGSVNRWCYDNKFRRGRFSAVFNGELFEKGTTVSITTDSLFVDDELVEAIISSEFLGPDNSGRYQFSFSVTSGLITLIDTVNVSTIQFQPDYILTWEEGEQTPDVPEDDMFLVTGTAKGTAVGKTEFEITIQDPLVYRMDCTWIVSGIHEIYTPNADIKTGTIDYITADGCFYQVNFYFDGSDFYDYLKF